MPASKTKAPPVAALWILFCVFWNCVGWILSALHQLNFRGYAIALFLGVGTALIVWRKGYNGVLPSWHLRRLRNRFARPGPLTFLILAVLSFLGGILYAPTNYDALAYRVPRVLHWLAAERWHWIHTEFQRLNARGCGFEWVAAPLIALTRTDRWLFLLNFISFCLLPGLLFSSLWRIGVRRVTAYFWMWLLPSGYCFVLQAGSLGNDLFAATFILAAFDFALRARQNAKLSELWISILAAALATAVKANTLPLMLVWAVVVACPFRRLLLQGAEPPSAAPRACRLTVGFAVAVIAVVSSFVPTAVLNLRHGGDWTGAAAEHLPFAPRNKLARPVGNCGLLALHSLLPPVMPLAKQWNERIAPRLLASRFGHSVQESFVSPGPLLATAEMETEEAAGLGFGVSVLLVISTAAAVLAGRKRLEKQRLDGLQARVVLAALIALIAFLETCFVRSAARLLTPYYAFLVLPFLWHSGHAHIIRARWWRGAALAAFALAALLLAINPARPLFPPDPILEACSRLGWSGPLMERAEKVYSVYGNRAEAFAPALRLLPGDVKVLGVVTFDDPEASLWKPFGSRRIRHVCAGDDPADLRAEGIRYIWINASKFASFFKMPLEQWLVQARARLVQSIALPLRAGEAPAEWHLVTLD